MESNAGISEVRSITNRKELEEVYDILEEVFPNGREFFQQRLDHDRTYSFPTTWVAKCDEKLVSTVQIFPFYCRIEDVEIKVGGLGSVATLPEYRGRGLSQQILNKQTAWMEEQEYDLSLLFAIITPFYEKLGWNVVPEPVYEIDTALVPFAKSETEYEIISFDASYAESIASIYTKFNHNRTYSVLRPTSFWHDQLQWPRWHTSSCLIALKNRMPVAYGQISKTMEGKAHIEELVYVTGEERAVVPLFHSLLQMRPDAATIQVKLPSDHVLNNILIQWGAQRQTINYAMWKVIRLYPLLKKLTGVFTRRVQQNTEYRRGDYFVHLVCRTQHAFLHVMDGEVEVKQNAYADMMYEEVELTQEQFISLLFQGADETSSMILQSKLLPILFPKQPFIFYITDKF